MNSGVAFVAPTRPTPDVVDLRSLMLPIRDQGQEGCCSGFSTAALREALYHQATGKPLPAPLSPAYLYARTRMVEGTFPQDAGATLADEISTLVNYGVCPETDLPYNQNPAEAPTPPADVTAQPFRIPAGQPVDRSSPASFEAVLANNQPIVFGMRVYSSFEKVGSDGVVLFPGTLTEKCLGGHAMLIVGYNRPKQQFIVRNSWSTSFGDWGYCYLPYSMLLFIFEAWTAAPTP